MSLRTISTYLIALAISFVMSCKEKSTPENTALEEHKTGLKDVATFPIGSAFSIRRLQKDEKLLKLQLENFNSITAGNDMKMRNVAKVKGEYNFEQADMMLEYAKKYNQRLFGHTLIWHSSTPDWLSEIEGEPQLLDEFMKDYIQTYVGRYKGKVDGWDVVNEGMNTIGGDYRETLWYKAFGKDYIARAFQYAHEADPEAILFYNDFNIERDTAKLSAVLRMINELKSQGVPISGLGFQMHIRMDIPDDIIAYALKKGAETGLQIHLSEVDIIFNKHDDTKGGGVQMYEELTDEMRQLQADKYERLASMYRTIVPKDQQYGITFWGYNDRDSWIKGFFNLKDWPCIFDENLEPKPAYFGFLKGLQE